MATGLSLTSHPGPTPSAPLQGSNGSNGSMAPNGSVASGPTRMVDHLGITMTMLDVVHDVPDLGGSTMILAQVDH